jgi:hypothetical protein
VDSGLESNDLKLAPNSAFRIATQLLHEMLALVSTKSYYYMAIQ